jgi:hypothetical protein
MQKLWNSDLGLFNFEITEGRFKLYDSNEEYIGYVNIENDTQEEICSLAIKVSQISELSDLVELGFCNNVIWGSIEEDLIDYYKELTEIDIDNEDLDLPINEVGGIYFIVDYTEF